MESFIGFVIFAAAVYGMYKLYEKNKLPKQQPKIPGGKPPAPKFPRDEDDK